MKVHLGVEADFRPARKAHPALLVTDLEALVARLKQHKVQVIDVPASAINSPVTSWRSEVTISLSVRRAMAFLMPSWILSPTRPPARCSSPPVDW